MLQDQQPPTLIFHVLPDLRAGLSLFILANYQQQQGGFPSPSSAVTAPVKSSAGSRAAICTEASQAGPLPSGAQEQMWEAERARLPLLLLAAEFLESLLAAQVGKPGQLRVPLGGRWGFIRVGSPFYVFSPFPINCLSFLLFEYWNLPSVVVV